MANLGTRASIGLWFVAMLGIGATLMARHEVALPGPALDPAFVTSITDLRPAKDHDWMAVHVLSAECRCSQRIAEHLVGSRRDPAVHEHVLLVGHAPKLEAQLGARGFDVVVVSQEALVDHYRIPAAPLLVVVAPDGTVRYRGGYTERKQGPAPRDREILSDLRGGRDVEPLPTFGCAVSEQLRAAVNPLGLP